MRDKNLTITILSLLLSCLLIDTVSAQFERRDFPQTKNLQKIQSKGTQCIQNFDDAGMDSFILAIMDEYHIAGGVYCVLKDGEIVWKLNAGYANIEEERLVTDSTLFTIASISKTFTATALMQLWEEDLFELDDDINDYLPDHFQVTHYYYPEDTITFKKLLTHTSGIVDNPDIWKSTECQGDSKIPLDTFLINYLVPGGEFYSENNFFRSFLPKPHFNYCNIAFGLLGYLVEIISGMPFDQYCQENIFEPLNINHTAWFLSQIDPDDMAMPYQWNGHNYSAFGHSGTPVYPAGTLKTSALQLATFFKLYMKNEETLLDSTTMEMMVKDHLGLGAFAEYDFLYRGQGLCWYEQLWGDHWLWGHTGGWYGVATGMFYDKKSNYGFIDLTNTGFHDQSTDGFTVITRNLAHFASLWGHVYAINLKADHAFVHKNKESLWITTRFVNRDQHPFHAQLVYTSTDSTIIDSVPLYDDGEHQDGDAEDGVYGCKIGPVQEEKEYILSVNTHDLSNDTYFQTNDLARFTSIGPIVIDRIEFVRDTVANPGDNLYMTIYLKNKGESTSADVSATLSCSDSLAEVRSSIARADYGQIGIGESVHSNRYYTVRITDGPFPHSPYELQLALDIFIHETTRIGAVTYHNYYLYWQDTLSIPVGIDNKDARAPTSIALSQNYPNPFNPTTTIKYQITKTSHVDLNIYNTLGQRVATLVSKKQTAGNYEIEWDAIGFASGIYYYRLTTNQGFVETKKLIIMR